MTWNHVDPEQTERPFSVGLLSWALPPEKSGLSRAALEIAHSVAEAGGEVRVFTLDRSDRDRDGPVEIIGCAIDPATPLARMRTWPAAGHLAAPIAFRRAVIAEHRRRPFDVIEATNWYAPGALIALFGPAPLVTRNSTPAAISLAQTPTLRNRIDASAAVALERRSAKASVALISNTHAHGQTIAALYTVAPPGPGHAVIGLSLPEPIVTRGQAASYPKDGVVDLLFVGRNEPRKGFDALVDAVEMLAQDADRGALAPFRVTLVGIEEADIAALSGAARNRLSFHHRVDEERLYALFAAAHVVLAPSRYESFGLVYQEAMAFGRPIVACVQDASARHFVGESGAGPLARECTGSAIADTIRPLIQNPALRDRYAAASRAASGRFTRETLGTETLSLYRSAIGSKGRSNRTSSSTLAPFAERPA